MGEGEGGMFGAVGGDALRILDWLVWGGINGHIMHSEQIALRYPYTHRIPSNKICVIPPM